MIAASIGVGLAALTIIIQKRLNFIPGKLFYSCFLVLISLAYVLMKFSMVDLLASVFFILIAIVSYLFSPILLALGFIGHSLFDLWHHFNNSHGLLNEYPIFCFSYDWIVGYYVFRSFK